MFIISKNEKRVLNTPFCFENFKLLFCADSAITTLYFKKLLPGNVQTPLKHGTTYLAIRSKDNSLKKS